MGAGNYYVANGRTVYIDNDQVYGEYSLETSQYEFVENELDFQFHYEDLIASLRSLIPDTYEIVDRYRPGRGEGVVIAENGLFEIAVVDCDTKFAVSVIAKGDEEHDVIPFAGYQLDSFADMLFGKMAEFWKLRVRTGGYTCAAYRPVSRAAVA